MDIIAVVRLSINQNFISDDIDTDMTWEELKLHRARGIVKDIKGQSIKVKSGIYENLMSGIILEVKQVKQRGKILYP